jgi:hypothetical protein
VRARLILVGLLTIAAACSRPAAAPDIDEALDERAASPDLALSAPSGTVPVASEVEVHRPEPAARPSPRVPALQPASTPQPMPEPLASDAAGDQDAAPATGMAPMPVVPSHVHPKAADPEEAVSGPSEDGGGKPQGVSTGLGPVPDRTWGDGIMDNPGIMDDPDPGAGMTGRGGAVITRGGAGGVHDDCAKHPRGGMVAGNPMGGMTGGTTVLVNDRDPRRGAVINERSPRTSSRPSFPRGGGFPRGGIR